MSIERLSAMFAGCTNYHPSESLGSGYQAALNRVEIAALMAGLNNHHRDFVYAYFGDQGGECRLIAHSRGWVASLASLENWSVQRGRPTISNIGAVAVFESVRPNVCPRCHGSGLIGGLVANALCRGCGGTGRIRMSNRKIADAIGVDEAAFRRTWCGRYERAMKYMQAIESEVNFVLIKAMHVDYCVEI